MRCISCGVEIDFNPIDGKVKCDHCGTSFNVDDSIGKNNSRNAKKKVNNKFLLFCLDILPIILPVIIIFIYFAFDIPLVIGIIVCGLSFILASINEDKTDKFIVAGKVISGVNCGFLILEFVLYVLSYFFE